jgi:poly(3-hydroxybutyrate) depolymerase
MWPADLRTFVPVETQPSEPVEDRLQRRIDISGLVGIVDTENELTGMVPGEQPVKQGCPDTTDVKVSGRAWCEACANRHRGHRIMNHSASLSRTIETMRTIAMMVATCVMVLPGVLQSMSAQGAPEAVRAVFNADGVSMTYGLSVPDGDGPHPLVLALHPGGGRTPYYGAMFMEGIVEPALRDWNPIIVAPDVPTQTWASDVSDEAVMALVEDVSARYEIDRARVLVTGFSLGGHGTWFFATRHPDVFTGAIPMAGSPGTSSLDNLGTMPVHIVHSRDDDVVPFGPASEAATLLGDRDHPVELTALDGVGHFAMGAYVEHLRAAGAWMVEQWQRN